MKMEMYWPESKVFLFGRLSLFPSSLDHVLDQYDLLHIADRSPAALYDFERQGYFKVKTYLSKEWITQQHAHLQMLSRLDIAPGGRSVQYPEKYFGLGEKLYYKVYEGEPLTESDIALVNGAISASDAKEYLRYTISDVDNARITNELTDYLKLFKEDELTTGTMTRPEIFDRQQSKLVQSCNSMSRQYGNRPIITDTSLKVDSFWEIILVNHFVTGAIKLLNMDYKGHVTPLGAGISTHSDALHPFAEFKILDHAVLGTSNASATVARQSVPMHAITAHITIDKNTTFVMLSNGEKIQLKKFRTGSGPLDFMKYLLTNSGSTVTLTALRADVATCRSRSDLTELVRECGFVKSLKQIFFPEMSGAKVRFEQSVPVTSAQVDEIRQILTGVNRNTTV